MQREFSGGLWITFINRALNTLASGLPEVFLIPIAMATTSRTQSDKAPITIFVVDDEPMLVEMAVMILEPLNFRVRAFRDPQTALAEFSASNPPPALIVTDYAMHTMSGMDLIRECKRIHPGQKIILLSGTVDESIYADSPTKPDHFLAKPYQIGDFVALVQSLVER